MLFLLRVVEPGSLRSIGWVKEGLIEQKQKIGSVNVWKFCSSDKKRLYEGVLHNTEHAVHKWVSGWRLCQGKDWQNVFDSYLNGFIS